MPKKKKILQVFFFLFLAICYVEKEEEEKEEKEGKYVDGKMMDCSLEKMDCIYP